jgi:hypothetical protein
LPIVFSSILFYWQPEMINNSVVTRHAEGFCPPDLYGRYDFDVALATDSTEFYAAACSSGLRTVELEIVPKQHIRWIDLQEYAPNEAWTDFGVRISLDGLYWKSVFEISPENPKNFAKRNGPTSWRIEIPANVTVRFIAIDYRASLGQNRLLLRRMSIFK